MKLSKKNLKQLCLVKLYVNMDDNSLKLCLAEIFNLFFQIIPSRRASYSLNYSADKELDINKIAQKLEALHVEQIENVIVFSLAEKAHFAVNFLKSIDKTFAEVRLVFPYVELFFDIFFNLSKKLAGNADIRYGYGTVIDETFDPVSETRIQKSFFGLSTTIDPVNKTWLYEPKLGRELLKGIYRINLIDKNLLTNQLFLSCIQNEPDRVKEISEKLTIVTCTAQDLRKILITYPDFSRYVRG